MFLDYNQRNDGNIFHSRAKLIASNSDIDKTFKSIHQSIMTKIKNYTCKNRIDLDVIIKHGMKIFACQCKENKWDKK